MEAEGIKHKKKRTNLVDSLSVVAETGLEPMTFGL